MLPVYYSLNEYLTDRFGEKVYKLSLDGGMTCPNRDGKISTGGCIFCSRGGSGDFAARKCESVDIQIERAKHRVRGKYKGNKFIAYFQNYTNTYGEIDYLENLFSQAIQNETIVALSIGTRPDCLGEDVISLLSRLNQIKPVFVELGLQTIHEDTAKLINRGYSLDTFNNAVKDLKAIGVNVVVHLILGLPYENEEMILESVDYVCKTGVDGIKLQLLHVLKDTKLEEMYKNGKFNVLGKKEYIDLLLKCINIIPNNIVIHRLTGDAPKNILVAPLWSADKKDVLNSINRELRKLSN